MVLRRYCDSTRCCRTREEREMSRETKISTSHQLPRLCSVALSQGIMTRGASNSWEEVGALDWRRSTGLGNSVSVPRLWRRELGYKTLQKSHAHAGGLRTPAIKPTTEVAAPWSMHTWPAKRLSDLDLQSVLLVATFCFCVPFCCGCPIIRRL